MYNWEIDENLKDISECFYKIKQENQVLKDMLHKVLNSIISLQAQCLVATEEINQCRPSYDIDAAIRDRLVDEISQAIIRRVNEVSNITVRPSLIDGFMVYGVTINIVKNTEFEQLAKLFSENEE